MLILAAIAFLCAALLAPWPMDAIFFVLAAVTFIIGVIALVREEQKHHGR